MLFWSSFQSRVISVSVMPCGELRRNSDSRRASSNCRTNCGGALPFKILSAESADLNQVLPDLHLKNRVSLGVDSGLRSGLQFLPNFVGIAARFVGIRSREKVLEFLLVSAAIFAIQRRFWIAAHDEYHRVASGFKMARAGGDINSCDASGKDGADHRARHDVFLGLAKESTTPRARSNCGACCRAPARSRAAKTGVPDDVR